MPPAGGFARRPGCAAKPLANESSRNPGNKRRVRRPASDAGRPGGNDDANRTFRRKSRNPEPSGFQVLPLSDLMGAEVIGLDLSQPLDEATREAVHQAFLTYQLLVFRDQKLDKPQQIAFTEQFGTLERHTKFNAAPTSSRCCTSSRTSTTRASRAAR